MPCRQVALSAETKNIDAGTRPDGCQNANGVGALNRGLVSDGETVEVRIHAELPGKSIIWRNTLPEEM
jgi:hypothetical protein